MRALSFVLLGVLTATAADAEKDNAIAQAMVVTSVSFRTEGKSQVGVMEVEKVFGSLNPVHFDRTLSVVPKGHNYIARAARDRVFMLRTQDFKFKVMVDIVHNDGADHPYKVGFTNLDVDTPVELKHGTEYAWILPTSSQWHSTHPGQPFEFRDSKGEAVATVTLVDLKDEL